MDEEVLLKRLGIITNVIYVIAVMGFAFGVWSTTLHMRLDNLERERANLERMNHMLTKIAAKLNIEDNY